MDRASSEEFYGLVHIVPSHLRIARCPTAQTLWLLDVAMMAVCASSMYCAGAEPFDDFQSEVDGDRPIRIVESEKLRAWASGFGKPAGARQRMLDLALPVVSHMGNIHPTGAEQLLPFDLDDAPEGPCVKQRLSLWSIPGKPQIFACPAWIECSIEGTGACTVRPAATWRSPTSSATCWGRQHQCLGDARRREANGDFGADAGPGDRVCVHGRSI